MNQELKTKLENQLISNHLVISREKAIKCFNLDIENYKGKYVTFYKFNGAYGWATFNNDSDWQDIKEYGISEDITDHLNDQEIEYFVKHPGLLKINEW